MPTEANPTQTAMTDAEAEAKARRIIADFATSYRDDRPLPPVGTTPPVAQPGRPPMSQKAADASALMLAAGVASLPIGGMTSLVLYTLGTVDPATLAIGATAPVALILAVSALLRAAGRAKADMNSEHHHHYSGPVHQHSQTVNSQAKLWGRSTTNL